jgi:NitT/TauT family transport system substrate-binding protein
MTKRWFWGTLLLALIPAPTARAASLTLVKVGYSAVDISYLPLKIAEDAKLFEKHGLDARTVLVRGGSTMMNALLAGEVSAAFIGGTPIILSRTTGADAKMVMSLGNTLVYQIVVSPQLKGKVNRIEDLKGRRVAISTRGAESESVILQVLRKYKISPREVTFLNIGTSGERLAGLKIGSADATALPSPQHLRAIRAGYPVILDVTKEQLSWFHTGVGMKESWLRAETKAAEALVKAFVEATYYGWKNKDVTRKVLARYIRSDDDEVLKQGYRDFLEYQPKDFRPSPAGIQAAIDELAEVNPKVKDVKPADIVNLTLIEQLERSGFMAEMKQHFSR